MRLLLFIALTQLLFHYCVLRSVLVTPEYPQPHYLFFLLITASVFISAAGYIINDYFDLQIDAVNKPDKVVVDRQVKRRWAIIWHLVLSASGVLISLYIGYKTRSVIIPLANTLAVFLLWFYSTTFKKKLLTGNIIIAALTAWVIFVVYFFTGAGDGWHSLAGLFDARKLFKLTILYAGFAFIVSLLREVVKDLEDMEGDARYHCKTMPIVWGVPATKVYAAVWLIVCVAALIIVQLYAWGSGWRVIILYSVAAIIIPLVLILKKLHKALLPRDYHRLSTQIKFVMLAGILSMVFFYFLNSY